MISNFRFTVREYFKIRGICPEMADVLDSDYVIDTESLKNNIEDGITFLGTEGTKRTKIILDPVTDRQVSI